MQVRIPGLKNANHITLRKKYNMSSNEQERQYEEVLLVPEQRKRKIL